MRFVLEAIYHKWWHGTNSFSEKRTGSLLSHFYKISSGKTILSFRLFLPLNLHLRDQRFVIWWSIWEYKKCRDTAEQAHSQILRIYQQLIISCCYHNPSRNRDSLKPSYCSFVKIFPPRMTDKKALGDTVSESWTRAGSTTSPMAVQDDKKRQKYYFWKPQRLTLSRLSSLSFPV